MVETCCRKRSVESIKGLKRHHARLLDVALIVEIRLPEASSSVAGGQWSETVRVHLDGQRTDDGVILLIDALSRWQADDSSANHCNPHVWTDMRQEKQLHQRLHHPQRRPTCEQNNMTDLKEYYLWPETNQTVLWAGHWMMSAEKGWKCEKTLRYWGKATNLLILTNVLKGWCHQYDTLKCVSLQGKLRVIW